LGSGAAVSSDPERISGACEQRGRQLLAGLERQFLVRSRAPSRVRAAGRFDPRVGARHGPRQAQVHPAEAVPRGSGSAGASWPDFNAATRNCDVRSIHSTTKLAPICFPPRATMYMIDRDRLRSRHWHGLSCAGALRPSQSRLLPSRAHALGAEEFWGRMGEHRRI
jgi:hypothetical protein